MNDKRWKRRMNTAVGLFFALTLVFSGKLVLLQVVHGADYAEEARRKIAKIETIQAARGELYDRHGTLLVGNDVRYEIGLSIAEMGDDAVPILRELMALCRREGLRWSDSLPIDWDSPHAYDEEASETAWNRFEEYLALLNIAKGDSAQQLMDRLAHHYGLPEGLSHEETRALVGVFYDCAIRQKGLTWMPYVFTEGDATFLAKIRELGLLGVTQSATASRRYETTAAAHILGRVGRMNEEEWATYQDAGYEMDAMIGKDGAEQAFESYLRPQKGVRTTESDTEGHILSSDYTTAPTPGSNVLLTLDLDLQEKTEEILAERLAELPEAQGAAVAILDVNDFGVLTLASHPTFDLSHFSAEYEALRDDPLRPLYNRALQGTYAPGSTFKMVTAVAALEEGIITPETQILDTGKYTYYSNPQPRCWLYRETGRTHELETVTEAITDSCNVFFYDVGRRLGITRLADYARKFGLGEPSGIELAGEASGVVASPEYTQSRGQTWYEGNTLSAAIGQENNRFTPLQLAAYVATLANGGERKETHLLHEVRSFDMERALQTQTVQQAERIAISPENLEAVKLGMLEVTQSGSAASYFQKVPVLVGAKTGSAQVAGSEESNAVFVCFAPYEKPEIAVAIVVEKGGSGSELGAIAAEILAYYFGAEEAENGDTQEAAATEEDEASSERLQNGENA